MLFDLRGRGRRRTVQGIYLGLAVLMGGGLVLFGVGGTGVGLFNQDNNGTSSGGTSTNTLVSSARKRAQANPRDAGAWLAYTKRAAANAEVDQTTGTYTAKGKQELPEAARAWSHYLGLKPKTIDPNAAQLMANVFDTDGLSRPTDRSAALQIVAQARPSLATFRNLALGAYAAGQTRLGDLAAREAVAKATKQNRATVKAQIDAAKKAGTGASLGTNAGGGAAPVAR